MNNYNIKINKKQITNKHTLEDARPLDVVQTYCIIKQ